MFGSKCREGRGGTQVWWRQVNYQWEVPAVLSLSFFSFLSPFFIFHSDPYSQHPSPFHLSISHVRSLSCPFPILIVFYIRVFLYFLFFSFSLSIPFWRYSYFSVIYVLSYEVHFIFYKIISLPIIIFIVLKVLEY